MRVLETEEVLDDGIPENEMVEPGAHALLTAGFTNDVSVGVVNPSKPATRKPSHKPRPSGSSSAAEPSQKPAGKRDERSKKQLLESIQDGPDTDERMAFVRAANANSTQSALTFDELKPQHDAAEYMQQGTNGMERSEEEKERDQRYLEVNVVLPKSKMLLSQITCEGCKNSALECCCCDDHDNTHCYALMSKAKLTPDEQMVYMKWGATSRYDPAIEVSDGDRIDRGLQPRDAEAVTAGQLRRPCIQSSQAWDPKSKCPWGGEGCKGNGQQVQLLSQIREIHFLQTGDADSADAVVVKLVKDMCQLDGTKAYEALQLRVGTSVCCANGECKLRAGMITVESRLAFIGRKNQFANEVNGNVRHQSDEHFFNDCELAHRLFMDDKYPEFGKTEAMRMVADTAQFSYFAEMREREAIGTTFAFVEACESLEMPWDHKTKQEFLDRAKMVPRHHIMLAIGEHVTSRESTFGVANKRNWSKYLKVLAGKWMWPDPITGIVIMVRIKNWEANGKPVLGDSLVDRINSTHPASALFGTAIQFHEAVEDYMDAAVRTPYHLEYTGTDASLCSSTKSCTYMQTMKNIGNAVGKVSALQLAMVARFMKDNGSFAANQTVPSMVHINGHKYAPASCDVYCNNNVTTLARVVNYARAYGLGGDYTVGYQQLGTTAPFRLGAPVVLKDFCTKFVPSLFLGASKDRWDANGHVVLPSQLVDLDTYADRLPMHHVPSTAATAATAATAGPSTAGPSTAGPSTAAPRTMDAFKRNSVAAATPLGKPNRHLLTLAATPLIKGKPSGMLLPTTHQHNGKTNLTPIYASATHPFPKLEASSHKAMELTLENYTRLVEKEKVLDPTITPFEQFCVVDVGHRLMLWGIERERAKKLWYEWLKTDRSEEFNKFVEAKKLPEEWECSMTEDPGDTLKGTIKVKADYDAYVAAEKHKAHVAVVLERRWFEKHPLAPEPTHFTYFCSMRRIDADEAWPQMRDLRLQYSRKRLLNYEAELLKLRDGVPGDKRGSIAEAIDKERKTELRRLAPRATAEQKDAKLQAEREQSPLLKERLDYFNLKSKMLDRTIKPRLARWMYPVRYPRSKESPEDLEKINAINEDFEFSMDGRFDGGAAHELERRRAALTKHNFNQDDRARARAELELGRQEQTRKADTAEKHKHDRPEAMAIEHDVQRAIAAENDSSGDEKGVDPVISDRLEDMQLSNIVTHTRVQVRKSVEVKTKDSEVSQDNLDFKIDDNYAARTQAQLDAPYTNPRMQALDWIDENGHDKGPGLKGPAPKRTKR